MQYFSLQWFRFLTKLKITYIATKIYNYIYNNNHIILVHSQCSKAISRHFVSVFNLTKTLRSWRQSANWCWSRSRSSISSRNRVWEQAAAVAAEELRAPRVLESRCRDTQRSSRSHTASQLYNTHSYKHIYIYIYIYTGTHTDKRTHSRTQTKLQQCGRFSFIFSLLLFSFRACACVCVRVHCCILCVDGAG